MAPIRTQLVVRDWLIIAGIVIGLLTAALAGYVKISERLTRVETKVEWLVKYFMDTEYQAGGK